MRLRVFAALFFSVALLISGPLAAAPLTSPLDGLELCTDWSYMPHPDWPECEYYEECICWMQPVDEPLAASPLAVPAQVDRDRLEEKSPKHATTPEQSQALACLVASRWYGINFNCEVY